MTVSNIFIIISAIVTALAAFVTWINDFWINNNFLWESMYHLFIMQFFLYQFIHAWILHFIFNAIFIYIFWNWLEDIIGKTKYIIFFVFNTFFVWIALLFLTKENTVWISWFCMAILTYFTLELYTKKNPEYKWWVTAIIVNIIIWFYPWISLIWHLFWAVSWVIFFLFNKNKKSN